MRSVVRIGNAPAATVTPGFGVRGRPAAAGAGDGVVAMVGSTGVAVALATLGETVGDPPDDVAGRTPGYDDDDRERQTSHARTLPRRQLEGNPS